MDKEEILAEFTSLLINKRYSYNSIKIYKNAVGLLLSSVNIEELLVQPDDSINKYLDSFHQYKYSSSYNIQAAAAIKLLCKEVLKKDINLTYPHIRIQKLPLVLTTEQVKALLININNIKYRALLSLIYSAGLRLNELINMKKSSVDISGRIINIADDNDKYRQAVLSEKMSLLLNEYYKSYHPNKWLFENNKNMQYSPRTVQLIFKKQLLASGLNCEASVQTLRHSFAVHMFEEGIDIRVIQQLLGHKSIKSTLIYTRLSSIKISKIVNPFDTI
jgi:site-specific recombinase XerD